MRVLIFSTTLIIRIIVRDIIINEQGLHVQY